VVDSLRGYETVNKSMITIMHGREVTHDPLKLASAGKIVFWITLIPLAIGLFASFFGFSFGIPFDFITTIQMIHYIPTLRIFIPTSLTNMFRAFAPYNFMGLTFGMWRLDQTASDNWNTNGEAATYNFTKMDFETNAWLLNCTPVVIVLCYISFVHPVLSCSRVVFGGINYLKNLDRKWKDNFIFYAIMFTFNIFCFNSMLNF